MAKCRNCGQETRATSDWACPWCGYPLHTGKRLDTTYAQSVFERRLEPVEIEIPGNSQDEPPEHGEMELPDETFIDEPSQTGGDTELRNRAEVEIPEPKNVEDSSREVSDSSSDVDAKPIDLSVEDLLKSYLEDDARADKMFGGRMLNLTGKVVIVEIQERRDIQCVRLGVEDEDAFQTIKCLFGSSHIDELAALEKGQSVTITGTFKGSLTAMNLIDCSFSSPSQRLEETV